MMKSLLTLTLGLLFTSILHGQNCSRTGTFVGAGDVDVTGSVTLEEQSDGSIKLTLSSDFVSDSGPDLDIYLGNANRVNSSSVVVERLKSLTGEQTYVIPAGITMNQYTYVTIHCTQYNHYYGSAELGAASGTCTALGTEVLEGAQGLLINGLHQQLQIEASQNQGQSQLTVLNLTGKAVAAESLYLSEGNTLLDLTLDSGIYVALLQTEKGLYSSKIYLR